MKIKKILSVSVLAILLSACQVKSKPVSNKEFREIYDANIATKAANLATATSYKISAKYELFDYVDNKYVTNSYEFDSSSFEKMTDSTKLKKNMSFSISHSYDAGHYDVDADTGARTKKSELKEKQEIKMSYDGNNLSYTGIKDDANKPEPLEYTVNKKEEMPAEVVNYIKAFFNNVEVRAIAQGIEQLYNGVALKFVDESLKNDNMQKEILKTKTNYVYRALEQSGKTHEVTISNSNYDVSVYAIRPSLTADKVEKYSYSGF